MKMRKLFAGLLATSIVAAGTSAFAAPIANDAGYDKTAGTYSIVSDLSGYGADQMTILIIPEAAYNAGSIEDADILYIDQAAADTANIFKSVGILGGTTLADGTYYAKIGGENIAETGIIVEKFTIKTTPAGLQITLDYGDVNADTAVNGIDASLILQKGVGLVNKFVDGESREIPETVGDVNADTAVNGIDASLILQKGVGLVEKFVDGEGNELTTYTYTYVAPTE